MELMPLHLTPPSTFSCPAARNDHPCCSTWKRTSATSTRNGAQPVPTVVQGTRSEPFLHGIDTAVSAAAERSVAPAGPAITKETHRHLCVARAVEASAASILSMKKWPDAVPRRHAPHPTASSGCHVCRRRRGQRLLSEGTGIPGPKKDVHSKGCLTETITTLSRFISRPGADRHAGQVVRT